jgi:hypothetical protein
VGRYNTLEDAGYKDIVQTDTLVSWDLALKTTRHKARIITKAVFHAKRDGKCFRLVVERHYPNRSSELEHSRIGSVAEVTADEYAAARAQIGPLHMHKRW